MSLKSILRYTSLLSLVLATGTQGTQGMQGTECVGQTITVPDSFSLFRGILLEGGVEEVQASDDQYLRANPGFILNACGEVPITYLFAATVDPTSTSLTVNFEAHANTPNLGSGIRIRNWNTGQEEFFYLTCHSGTLDVPAFNDQVTSIDLSDRIQDFVEPTTGEVRFGTFWGLRGFLLVWPYEVRLDHVYLETE